MNISSAVIRLVCDHDLRERFRRNVPESILDNYSITPDGKLVEEKPTQIKNLNNNLKDSNAAMARV